MALELFHPLVRGWFERRFGAPTEPQRRGWPEIAAGKHTLIAAPTGSGKTLAAFMVCLDRLWRQWLKGVLADGVQVVYVSPLKALSNDIQRNLQTPLAELAEVARGEGLGSLPIRVALRTGDTPAGERAALRKHPPHILVTTPESLYLLLTAERTRPLLATCDTVIVDEIHAMARDKRGSHFTLTLERLAALCPRPPARIGLSATQRPIERIASFLIGNADVAPRLVEVPTAVTGPASNSAIGQPVSSDEPPLTDPAADRLDSPRVPDGVLVPINTPIGTATGAARQLKLFEAERIRVEPTNSGTAQRGCTIIDTGHARERDLAIEVPPTELSAVCSHEQWAEIYAQLTALINSHRSTLVFVNTRRMAERMSHQLRELLGEEAVAGHHGSLSRAIRLSAEQRLKAGELKAIVATASLEMGIDIGYIDLVCQIGSPRSIAAFLQRVGRSGHSLGAVPKGRLFPLTRDELIECLALVRASRCGILDTIEIPEQPLDILAQQLIAAVACEEWSEQSLYELCRRAWPYRNLTPADFNAVVRMVSDGISPRNRRGAYLHRDQIHGKLRARKGARLAAITSGGAIPENAEYRVVTEDDNTFVGTVDEDFAIESTAGDIFLLGNTSWRIRYVRAGEVVVRDAEGAPPTIPFWLGEAPGRTFELSQEISEVRRQIASRVGNEPPDPGESDAAGQWVKMECGASDWAARQAARYVAAETAAIGLVPTADEIVFEKFFDESGGMQLVIHAPLGARINRAWGLAFRKRFCRSFDFELQAAATDNGILLSLGPQHSVPTENLFKMLGVHNGRYLLEQAAIAVPMFQVRWRWNVTRALGVLRFQSGKKVAPFLQRFRSDDLLAAAFPETVGCLENHHGDVEIPDHPLVRQTMHDCLHEAMDIDRWLAILDQAGQGSVRLIARDTREPSPFCHEILNANPYAFLDDAPLEERRTRAVTARRGLSPADFRDLAILDPEAIAQVQAEAWPLARDAEELHDALMNLVALRADEMPAWRGGWDELTRDGRATCVAVPIHAADGGIASVERYWIAAERWPVMAALFPQAKADPEVKLPDSLRREYAASDARVELVRGRVSFAGPITALEIATLLHLDAGEVESALEALEGQGLILRGRFRVRDGQRSHHAPPDEAPAGGRERRGEGAGAETPVEWCERRLLARIHRRTLDGLRRQIQPVETNDFLRYLLAHQRVSRPDGVAWNGPAGVREAIQQLQGFEMPAGAWENVLAARIPEYDPQWLDQLFMSGEVVWGRLQLPARDEGRGPSMAAMTRTMPISLALRADLPWLLPPDRASAPGRDATEAASATADGTAISLRSNAQQVLAALRDRGALFFQEIVALTQLLPSHVEDALRELAAVGFVTSDAFAAVRAIAKVQRGTRRAVGRTFASTVTPTGRWSLFPGLVLPASREERLQRWCGQLLRRYGVLFRDLGARESAAPTWPELAPVLRRMELRGELRGGRFVAGVGGEQFAVESAVVELRKTRDRTDEEWHLLVAADPVNLFGVVTSEPRVPAIHTNWLVVRQGKRIAARQGGVITFTTEMPLLIQADMRRALEVGSM